SDPDPYPTFKNIWGDITNKNAILTNHNIEISGGAERIKYYASLGYLNQEGMWPATNSRRFNLTLNLDAQVTKTTTVSININGRNQKDKYPAVSTGRIFELIGYLHPLYGPLRFSNGLPGTFLTGSLFNSGYQNVNNTTLYSQISIEQTFPFIPGLKARGTVAYDPSNTSLDGKSDLNAVVYFLDNKDYPVADLNLNPTGKLLKGDFTIPASAKAFFVKISKDGAIDDNNEKGYLYMVYKDKKPVAGAYASKAYVLFSGMGTAYAKIKMDPNEAFALYKQEFQTYPQSEKEYQSMYYSLLASGKNPAFAPVLDQKLASLIKSNDEKELILASNLLRRGKKVGQADSLTAVIKAKFPNGELVKNEMGMAFNKETDLTKKEALYNEYVKKYPENTNEKMTIQDNFRLQLANAYLQQNKLTDYKRWESKVNNKLGLAGTLNNVAYNWAKKGEQLDLAAELSKSSLDVINEKINNPDIRPFSSPKSIKAQYHDTYNMYADTYAFILFKQNKLKEALAYQEQVYNTLTGISAEVNEHYATILKASGEEGKAKQVIETAIKTGFSTDVMNKDLKTLYIKSKGSDTGYDQYFISLKNAAAIAARAALAKEMINQPAPVFTLKDTSGKAVSLASLKGKLVVVDFWATWCGPCKASFPGMQLAVNKYKDDPNVKFVFIDT
ncbi:redoxin domain-containing protein, partial [bacterium]